LSAIKTFFLKIGIWLKKYQAFFQGLLGVLGIWGPFLIAAVDSAAFGIPLDYAIVSFTIEALASGRGFLYVFIGCFMGAVGSVIGSLVPFWIGRKGGEPLLLKKISHARLEQLRDRYESWEFFFVFIPSMLPPPTPMKLIIFAAGAFEMRATLFSAAIFFGRLLRFGIVAFLTFRYGKSFIDHVTALFIGHKTAIGTAMLVLLAAIFLIVYRKLTSGRALAHTEQ